MRVFISYSHKDKPFIDRIVERLQRDGHDIWIDSVKIRPGDNIQRKINEGLQEADALVIAISENSIASDWMRLEFSSIAIQQISKKEKKVLPIRIDKAEVPSYLSTIAYIDFYSDFNSALERLSKALSSSDEAPVHHDHVIKADGREIQLTRLRESLRRGRLTLVSGAGVSVEAGIPAWNELLVHLLGSVMKKIAKDHSLNLGEKAAFEFQKRYITSALILAKYLRNNLGRDFLKEMRDAIYASNPSKSALLDSIVQLARPQRDARPLESIITFNFDDLIEENLRSNNISNKSIFSESIRHGSNELPIYHVHGFLPRAGRISEGTELVFSEDAYHSQFIEAFSWSNLIQLTKLTQNTCLFIGVSLTDPNLRRLLDVAWRKNPDKSLSHYIVKRLPKFSDGDVLDDVSKVLEEQDANALGLNVVWVSEFGEIPKFLKEILSPEDN